MTYPEILLPADNRKSIAVEVLEDDDYYLVRYLDGGEYAQLIDPVTERVSPKKIYQSDQSKDLSTFLAGHYEADHVKIVLVGEKSGFFGGYCGPDQTFEAPIHPIDFIINHERGCWNLRIADVSGKHIKVFDRSKRNNTVEYKACCKIEHSPTRCNFWHFSIRWYIPDLDLSSEGIDPDTGEPLPSRSAWKSLKTNARAFLAEFCKVGYPMDPDILPNEHYLKAV